ncbi:hypothetical protein HZH68_008357 [Vespula germanica]|uniref:Uncharacterized protein n=1 Tax=Vespula germanica TaxID=30212 RepID=A0A834N7J7_VESGE|nr:hypothetical protein HZH68_008357 [Vespula germanica]
MAFGSEKNKVRINPGRVGAVKGIRVRPGTRMRVLHESKVSRFIVSRLRDDQLQNCNDQSHCRGGSLYKNVPSTFFRSIAKGLNAIIYSTDNNGSSREPIRKSSSRVHQQGNLDSRDKPKFEQTRTSAKIKG